MRTQLEIFTQHRPRLFGLAYRMLGTRADAEDILQDAWIRWSGVEPSSLYSPDAWLVTTVTRLAIDRLRAAQRERENYVGYWLPEPLVDMDERTPEEAILHSSDVSFAFLRLLERLSPMERAAYLLREVFDYDYTDIAQVLRKTKAACRQLVHRASERVADKNARYNIAPDVQRRLLERFIQAARTGDRQALEAMISDDAELTGDGGGKVPSFHHVLTGSARIANLHHALARKYGKDATYRIVWVNGMPGLARYFNGTLESIQSCESDGNRISGFYVVRNPDKLSRVPIDLRTTAAAE